MIHKLIEIFTGVAEAENYKLFITHVVAIASFIVALEGATEFFKLMGAICFAIAAFMALLIKRKQYMNTIKEVLKEIKQTFKK